MQTNLSANHIQISDLAEGSEEKNGIAKRNPVLMQQAVEFYLSLLTAGKTKPTDRQTFTFISLYSDDEPYTLEELTVQMAKRIAKLEKKRITHGTDVSNDLITLSTLKEKLKRLQYLLERWRA